MKVVLAPNSFRDALMAPQVAAAMAAGVRRGAPRADVVSVPLADGGDGTLEVLMKLLGGRLQRTTVVDPRRRPVEARWALSDDGTTAILEMAEASGLRRLAPEDRDPLQVDTGGTGELIRAALDQGARKIVLGAGGSGTIDGGAGALAALGAVFRDAAGNALPPHPAGLDELAAIDLADLDPRLAETEITVLADVSTQVERHVAVYGPQKGARPEDHSALEANLLRLAELAEHHGHPIADRPWYGAAGCMAGGLAAFAGARVLAGGKEVARLGKLDEHLRGADLVLSGEGRMDASSFEDKLPSVVAGLAQRAGVPLALVAGHLSHETALSGVVASFALSAGPESLEQALARTGERLEQVSEQIVRLFAAARLPAAEAAIHPARLSRRSAP
ncbi:MAG: glycerate kinase [Acidobacteriota bacterium]|nr:glycerate kinase [Acidobacteriota bacterium]